MEQVNSQELLANQDQKKLFSEQRQAESDGKKKSCLRCQDAISCYKLTIGLPLVAETIER